jgi:uncharacterized protein YndB with AHSA1/START domain
MTQEPTTRGAEDALVRTEIVVNAPIETAFDVFTEGIDTWWPRAHHLGGGTLDKEVVEPRVGGRCYGSDVDGTECQWGTVLAWDRPHHLAFAWQINLAWTFDPDVNQASRVDVHFGSDGPGRTKVTLVHSELARHGTGWDSMRGSVGSAGGWPGMLQAFAKAAGGAAA